MSYFLRKKWMVNLSGSGKILWALNMKKDSYPYLICMTVSGLIFIFLFFWWRADIYRVTFLNQSISHYYILFSMGIAFLLSLFWVKKGIVKQRGWKSLSAYLKVYAGMCIFAGFFLIIPLKTLTYFLPGETSSYVAPYRYTSGSSKSCSGAEVDDPELHENIRICYPYGNYEYDNIIYVEKKINILGAVVTYAQTARDDTE
ncbi:TPA: hypothetical protein HID98_004359 [Escherichia coli]|uniref:hypothetical protein n=1 Tax=Escherichia coli TaxID=562 RepID=UPI000F09C27F|nr:hypothetical protein [Escherichia coli]HAH7731248.1 hypothetical protein [Escherichia coli]HDD8915028.1 hypothetical protein [Escherichia coli]HDD9271174.1 hypothetical protein [Escherichia coli]HDP7890562.1 hypothetical protein [Escherichia coli]HDP7935244.1 hypothetical protein [Escherichia coli]